ncbi:hypothetical protein FOXYSP1_20003 [Fusarium oxysporum f. sp. phaseoli]
MGSSRCMALPHKQIFVRIWVPCGCVSSVWLSELRYSEVPLLPGDLGCETRGVETNRRCES